MPANLDLCIRYIGKKYQSEEIIFELIFFWYGLTNILEEWIDNKIDMNPETLVKYVCKCFPRELEPYILRIYNIRKY